MEAKDTAIDLKGMGEENESLRIQMERILLEQAKITWDLAIKKVVELLPEIPTRFEHNGPCFDCVQNIKRQLKNGG